MIEIEIEEYFKVLDKALLAYISGDEKPFVDHVKRYKDHLAYCYDNLDDKELTEASVMKAITGRTSIPINIRKKAKAYLNSKGLGSFDDGDL